MVTERLSSLIQKILYNFLKHFYFVQHWLWDRKYIKRGLSLSVFFIYLLFGPELLFAHNPPPKDEEKKAQAKFQQTLQSSHLAQINTEILETEDYMNDGTFVEEASQFKLEKVLDEVDESEEDNGPLDPDEAQCYIEKVDKYLRDFEDAHSNTGKCIEKLEMLQSHKLLILKHSKELFQQKVLELQSKVSLDHNGRPAPPPPAAEAVKQALGGFEEQKAFIKTQKMRLYNERFKHEDRDEKNENCMGRVCALERKLYGPPTPYPSHPPTPCHSPPSTPCSSPPPSPPPSPFSISSELESVFTSYTSLYATS